MTATYVDQNGNFIRTLRDKVTYEWDIETYYEGPDSDIEDHHFFDKLDEMPDPTEFAPLHAELVLVRDTGNEIEGLTDRTWAYVKDGVLPKYFENGKEVPKRFHDEFKRG